MSLLLINKMDKTKSLAHSEGQSKYFAAKDNTYKSKQVHFNLKDGGDSESHTLKKFPLNDLDESIRNFLVISRNLKESEYNFYSCSSSITSECPSKIGMETPLCIDL